MGFINLIGNVIKAGAYYSSIMLILAYNVQFMSIHSRFFTAI
jgi:hypothetical protein